MRIAAMLLCMLAVGQPLCRAESPLPLWERIEVGHGETAFVAVAVSPATPERVYAASRNAVYESRDGGRSWRERLRLTHPRDRGHTRLDDPCLFEGDRTERRSENLSVLQLDRRDHGQFG